MHYELTPKITLIVRGPASVTLLTGQVTILSAPLQPKLTKTVPQNRQLPLETQTYAQLDVVLGKSAEIFEVHGSSIPESWRAAAAALTAMGEGRVIILGRTDAGKSTLCVHLVNKLLGKIESLRVIDADIGQSDLGPPTTISRAVPTQPIASLPELSPNARVFIGHTSPGYVERKLIGGIRRLSMEDKRTLTIINTDGWVEDWDAIRYKSTLVSEVDADLVLGLAAEDELQPILSGVRSRAMKVNVANEILERSRADRRNIRFDSYRRFLSGGVRSRVESSNLQITAPKNAPSVSPSNLANLRNLIVGILNQDEYLVQIGILVGIEKDALVIYSTPAQEIRRIELGFVKLSTSGRELGFL